MLVGGVSALLLQMLHPAALAGVWDHSDFRRDSAGRLRRTADFLSQTTFGSREEALQAIARIRRIHDGIDGHLPDGSPYRANDPDLLTWVHVAGVSSFLRSYMRYSRPLSGAEQDRYYSETAITAELLARSRSPRAGPAPRHTCRPFARSFGSTAAPRKSPRPSSRPPHPVLGSPRHATS